MDTIMSVIDNYVVELLHIDEEGTNKLLDVNATGAPCFVLTKSGAKNHAFEVFEIIKEKYGQIGNTTLANSAINANDQIFGAKKNVLDWTGIDGSHDPTVLHTFIAKTRKEIVQKGNNPLFLSIGAVEWDVVVSTEKKRITSPLLIFSIRLISTGADQSVNIEFVADDVYLNPCFFNRLRRAFDESVALNFPLPAGCTNVDTPVDITKLCVNDYMATVAQYIKTCSEVDTEHTTHFCLSPDLVAISAYNHEDLCMYYDIRRNFSAINTSALVQRLFTKCAHVPDSTSGTYPRMVLPFDSAQERMIMRAVSGDSFVIQGPPGTGKTLTIANMISALIVEGKRVLFVSQKESALAEVYRKVPDALRRYILPLYCETESDAAVFKPATVMKSLAEALERTTATSAQAKYRIACSKKAKTMKQLNAYFKTMFAESTMGGSYYHTLDAYLADEGIAPVDFIPLGGTNIFSYEDYLNAKNRVDDMGTYFATLSDCGHFRMCINPWYNMRKDLDFAKVNEAAAFRSELKAIIDAFHVTYGTERSDFRLETLAYLSHANITMEQRQVIEEGCFTKDTSKIAAIYNAYVRKRAKAQRAIDFGFDVQSHAVEFDLQPIAEGTCWSIEHVCRIEELRALFTDELLAKCASSLELHDKLNEYRKIMIEYAVAQDVFEAVFDKTKVTSAEAKKLLQKGIAKLDNYFNRNVEAPSRIDIGATRVFNALKELSFSTQVAFSSVTKALQEYQAMLNMDERMKALGEELCMILRRRLSEAEVLSLVEVFNFASDNNVRMSVFVGTSRKIYAEITRVAEKYELRDIWKCRTVADYNAIVEGMLVLAELYDAMNRLGLVGVCSSIEDTARLAAGIAGIKTYMTGFGDLERDSLTKVTDKLFDAVEKLGSSHDIPKCFAAFRSFATENYSTEHTFMPVLEMTVSEGEFVADALADSNAYHAMHYFQEEIKSISSIDIYTFFRPFIYGEREDGIKYGFGRIFEHSVYAAAQKDCATLVSKVPYIGRTSVDNIRSNFCEAEQDMQNYQAALSAEVCGMSIHSTEHKFDFLRMTPKYSVARKLFKDKASEILTLKRCLIMSPSTVSLYLRPEEYMHFDVAIVDEASQIMPQYLLPVALRSKQLIIVGDEHQMPPIRHFKRRAPGGVNTEEGLVAVKSILDLVRQNESFTAEKLVCHYRSVTEELIDYSLRYYSDMLTFPAVVPHNDKVGVRELYVEDGYCEDGANTLEAHAVAELLVKHFEQFFNSTEGTLSSSVGVVVFGVSQRERLEKIIATDYTDLNDKIMKMSSKLQNSVDKSFFICPIEKVQGQEIDHLIISMTYGKSSTGTHQSFGLLNQSDLGEKIFNVAVTRAKQSVTVVHSIRSQDITLPSLQHIRDYLYLAEQFGQGANGGFVTTPNDSGFVSSVVNTLISLGVDSKRIVVNYGITANSLRIPIAILSEDNSSAVLGLWCETTPPSGERYIDFSIRYPAILRKRGWTLYNMYIYDWASNRDAEVVALTRLLRDMRIIL